MLVDILKEKKCFKLVLGAGNKDINQIRKLVALYSKAGCNFFDLAAEEDVILAAKQGLKIAGINKDRYLCVSVGMKGDPHINKAYINGNCTKCKKCEKACIEKAISDCKVDDKKCIGCAKCVSVCLNNAIEMRINGKNIIKVLPSLIQLGIDCIELHAISDDEDNILKTWQEINKIYNGTLSVCLDRSNLSNRLLIERLKKILKIRKPYTTIIQADGAPMSGGDDSYKTTLQTVATAEIIQNEGFEAYLLLSGGTNSKTPKLAQLCKINYNGISIGSYARKIVREYIERDDFLENKEIFNKALKKAKKLVDICLNSQ